MPIKVDRIDLNDSLVGILERYGWFPDGLESEYDRLNDLTHEVGDALDEFLNYAPQTEADSDRMEA